MFDGECQIAIVLTPTCRLVITPFIVVSVINIKHLKPFEIVFER